MRIIKVVYEILFTLLNICKLYSTYVIYDFVIFKIQNNNYFLEINSK